MGKNQKYVVQCIKGNNNRFGFGYRHKAGQFVSYSGRSVSLVEDAYQYISGESEKECGLLNMDDDKWKYYRFLPIKIILQ